MNESELKPRTYTTNPSPDFAAESLAMLRPADFDGWPNLATCRIWEWLVCSDNNAHVERAATEAAIKGDHDALRRTIRAHLKARRRDDLLPLVDGMDAEAIAKELMEINGAFATQAKGRT